MKFTPALRTETKLRLALNGPAGSGKTYTALRIASALSNKVAVIDTEHRRSTLYADEFAFDLIGLETYSPATYVAALNAAESFGYEVVIVDSLSHAWAGKDGALEMADRERIRSTSNNSFFAWRNVTPQWQTMIERMLSLNAHLIGTFRAKTEYVIETDEKGKSVPRKIGLGPVFRDGAEFEFDIFGDMTSDHQLVIGKTRCKALKGRIFHEPGDDFARILNEWLGTFPANTERNANENLTDRINRIGRELYHDMWPEKEEDIAAWASGHRVKTIAGLNDDERTRVFSGMEEKMRQAA